MTQGAQTQTDTRTHWDSKMQGCFFNFTWCLTGWQDVRHSSDVWLTKYTFLYNFVFISLLFFFFYFFFFFFFFLFFFFLFFFFLFFVFLFFVFLVFVFLVFVFLVFVFLFLIFVYYFSSCHHISSIFPCPDCVMRHFCRMRRRWSSSTWVARRRRSTWEARRFWIWLCHLEARNWVWR